MAGPAVASVNAGTPNSNQEADKAWGELEAVLKDNLGLLSIVHGEKDKLDAIKDYDKDNVQTVYESGKTKMFESAVIERMLINDNHDKKFSRQTVEKNGKEWTSQYLNAVADWKSYVETKSGIEVEQ